MRGMKEAWKKTIWYELVWVMDTLKLTLWVLNQKLGGKPPKMDGENNGSKPYV